jgi:AraC-like DNA-binding protein
MLPGRVDTCVFGLELLSRVAATAPSRRPGPIRFTSLEPRSTTMAAQFWATRSHIADLLANPDAAASPLIVADSANLLAAVTLATFPNSTLVDPTIEDRHDAHPDTLRRAIAFIEANPHRDISIADIAAASFVTVRAVQLAFQRHLDTAPLAYLRRVRLACAHRDLVAGYPDRTTVTKIAVRWGFANASSFAAYYRAAYGVLPSHTLRERD